MPKVFREIKDLKVTKEVLDLEIKGFKAISGHRAIKVIKGIKGQPAPMGYREIKDTKE